MKAYNTYLQHLHITLHGSDISDVFHGGLESVFLSAQSVTPTVAGITADTALNQNSPKLYIFIVHIQQIVDENNITINLKGFKDTLKMKFLHAKSFNV